jgi:hypothetical protein
MSVTRSIAVAAAAALLAGPSAAIAAGPPPGPGGDHPTSTSNPGVAHRTADTPGADAPAATKAKAYGKHCQGQSKKHVKGQKGTPFSRCVTAMAKVATGEETSPRAACATLSHKHKAGAQGTPFGRCVVAARRLAEQPAGA